MPVFELTTRSNKIVEVNKSVGKGAVNRENVEGQKWGY
jgi:hypothetical protein